MLPAPRPGALHVLGGLNFRAAVVSASAFGHAAVLALLFSGAPAAVDMGGAIVVELISDGGRAPPISRPEAEPLPVEPEIVMRDANPPVTRASEKPDGPVPPPQPVSSVPMPRQSPVANPPARAARRSDPNSLPTPPNAQAPYSQDLAANRALGRTFERDSPQGTEVSAPPELLAPGFSPWRLAPPNEEALTPPTVPAAPLAGNPKPDYPAEALRRSIEGRVVLGIVVSAVGEVEQASVVATSGHAALDAAALAAVRAWKFQPAQRLGVAVAFETRIPFVFRIRDDGR